MMKFCYTSLTVNRVSRLYTVLAMNCGPSVDWILSPAIFLFTPLARPNSYACSIIPRKSAGILLKLESGPMTKKNSINLG